LKSRTEIIAESGRDFREVVDQIAEEEAYAKSKGVSLAVIDSIIAPMEDDSNAKKTDN
jgi:capsid protein